jgi:lipoyl(octanoyl) transferase
MGFERWGYDQLMASMLVCDLGAIEYRAALQLQERLRDARRQRLIPDTLLLLEHSPAVYTRGRRSAPGELTMGEAWYAERGIEVIETNRGGRVTYHGPGQLVGYPIVAINDVLAYVRMLERAIVDALSMVQMSARARTDEGPDYTGVWVQGRKIASIGVHVAHGVTTHGFAVNVEARSLEPFGWIVACGLPDVEMTSIESERGRGGPAGPPIELPAFAEMAAAALADGLGLRVSRIEPDDLNELVHGTAAPLEDLADGAAAALSTSSSATRP